MNTQLREVVTMKFSDAQNKKLEQSFQEFYKLDSGPKIARTLIVEKPEFNRYMKSLTKSRTQYESKPLDISSFDMYKIPFDFIETKTEFLLPGRNLLIHEILNEPNGYSQSIDVIENGTINNFESYFKAECYVLSQFLKERG